MFLFFFHPSLPPQRPLRIASNRIELKANLTEPPGALVRIVCFAWHAVDPNRGPGDEDQGSIVQESLGQTLIMLPAAAAPHELARIVNTAGVQVLVDLLGHLPIAVELGVTELLAFRPAPLLVNAQVGVNTTYKRYTYDS